MSTINTEHYTGFIGGNHQSERRLNRTTSHEIIERESSSISSTTVFGFLMALTSAALLMLTGQPPWLLLPALAGLVMALLLARVLNRRLQV